jgi:SNF2 family DNA or RNA helicase
MKRTSSVQLRPLSQPSREEWIPTEYMLRAIEFLVKSQGGAGLFLDAGLRKTSIVLAAFLALRKAKKAKRMLVIAPLRVAQTTWADEVEKWDRFEGLKVSVLHGKFKQKRCDAADVDIYTINPEGLDWLMGKRNFRKLGVDVLVVDESTKFKNIRSQRSHKLRSMIAALEFKYRWALTGSAFANRLMDIFGQARIIDESIFGPYITAFRQKYFVPTGYKGYDWRPTEKSEENIMKRLAPWVLRLNARDHIDLPDEVPNPVWVDLPDNAMELYVRLETEMFTTLLGNSWKVESVSSLNTKLRQLATGAIYEPPNPERPKERTWVQTHTAKLDALREIYDENGGAPMLVAYEYAHEADQILDVFPEAVEIKKMKGEDKLRQFRKDFNAGRIPLAIAHAGSVAHGLNLQEACSTVVFYNLTPDNELHYQFIRRILRSGNKAERVIIHYLLARGTIDKITYKTVQRKSANESTYYTLLQDYANELRRAGRLPPR